MKRYEELLRRGEDGWISLTQDEPSDSEPLHTVFVCHGLSGDKIGPQRLLCLLSEHLVRERHCRVIRFDFHGSGLSSGLFIDTTFHSMVEDALLVAREKESSLSTVWLGISTGSIIALMASATRRKGEKVIAISNGFAEQPKFTFPEDGELVSIREGQFFLPRSYFSQREALHPRKVFFPFCPSIHCVLGSLDSKHVIEAPSLQEVGANVHVMEGADHLFTDPVLRKALFIKLGGLI